MKRNEDNKRRYNEQKIRHALRHNITLTFQPSIILIESMLFLFIICPVQTNLFELNHQEDRW